MVVDWVFVALMVVAVLLTGISKSGFAGGVGVVAVPLISLKASPTFAVAVMLPLLIVMDVFSLKAWWHQRVGRLLWLMFPPAVLGVVVGYFTYGWFDEGLLTLLLGIFSVLFGLWGLLKPLRGRHCCWGCFRYCLACGGYSNRSVAN